MSEFLASYVLRVLFSTLVRRTEAIRLRGVGTGWRIFRSNGTGQSCIICAVPARNGERSASAARAATAQLVVWARTRFMRVVCRSIALGLLVA